MSRLIILIGLVAIGWFIWKKYAGEGYLGGLGTGQGTAMAQPGGSQLY